MALSLLSQQPSLFDLPTLFDPFPLQSSYQTSTTTPSATAAVAAAAATKIFLTNFNNDFPDQMEYTNHHQHQHNHQQQQQQQQQQQALQQHYQQQNSDSNSNHNNSNNNLKNIINNHNNNSSSNGVICGNTSNLNNNTNNNNNNNTNANNNNTTVATNTTNIDQTLNNSNRHFMNGYTHPHISSDYVINFVDSPPNSEESWTDEHSKGSPGPQIIDVQTIFSNSGSRKRRMDWDSLDIGQSGNAQTGDIANKIPHHEKDKQKREKTNSRANWTDDIGFDLNAEFNSNSYLSNESFLSFSPALTVLKQEPQTDQLKVKSPLNTHSIGVGDTVPKIDKSSPHGGVTPNNNNNNSQDKTKNALNNPICGCGSPQSSPHELEHTGTLALEKANNGNGNGNATGHGNTGGPYNVDKSNLQSPNSVIQQLSVVDTTKIENTQPATGPSHTEDHKFQYILAAATSIATKNNEETLTYLNQGQSYEIKLKKIGDLSFYRDKVLKSVIKICFHERRLQFMEREQMQQWQASRPGERIIEVDVPLSYGLCHVSQPLNPNFLNTVEIFWDPLKEVGVYIKVNCISTEFTPKKHGGEKGVPFRLQIETYIESTNPGSGGATVIGAASVIPNSASQSPITTSPGTPGNLTPNNNNNNNNSNNNGNNNNGNNNNTNNNNSVGNLNAASLIGSKQPVHAAACQIKVFKLKGADRKHKQDREKIQKRPQSEQEKFQPSYECTIMNDIPLDLITPSATGCFSPEYMKIWPNSPVHIPKYDGILPYANASPAANTSPIAINSVTSTNSPSLKMMDTNIVSPQQTSMDMDDLISNIIPESTPAQVAQWLTHHRLTAYLTTFAHFSGSDILRMSKEDLIQICGIADGIRMFNILRAKAIAPRLTVYVSMDGSNYNAVYLLANTSKELMQKICKLPGFYEMFTNSTNGALENGNMYNSWGMHSKYSGSGSNIYNDVNKSFIYVAGPSGVHVTVTDEVLNNEIKDGSLYTLEVQNGKVVMKSINKNDN